MCVRCVLDHVNRSLPVSLSQPSNLITTSRPYFLFLPLCFCLFHSLPSCFQAKLKSYVCPASESACHNTSYLAAFTLLKREGWVLWHGNFI